MQDDGTEDKENKSEEEVSAPYKVNIGAVQAKYEGDKKKSVAASTNWRNGPGPFQGVIQPRAPGAQGLGAGNEPSSFLSNPWIDMTPESRIRDKKGFTYKKYGIRQPREYYLPGVVFSAYHHISSNVTENIIEVGDEFLSPRGQWILSKQRKFIVIERYVNHCITIPIFTYNRKGLADKMKLTHEYIGVFDSNDAAKYQSHSKENGYVLAKRAVEHSTVPKEDFHFFSGLNHAHLTAHYSHDYATTVQNEGVIFGNHLKKLLGAYYAAKPKEKENPISNQKQQEK